VPAPLAFAPPATPAPWALRTFAAGLPRTIRLFPVSPRGLACVCCGPLAPLQMGLVYRRARFYGLRVAPLAAAAGCRAALVGPAGLLAAPPPRRSPVPQLFLF